MSRTVVRHEPLCFMRLGGKDGLVPVSYPINDATEGGS